MILLDTSFLVAFTREKDVNYARALELSGAFEEHTVITNHILHEYASFLFRKDGPDAAYRAGKQLLESDVQVVCLLQEDLMPALEIVKKYGHLDFGDASSIVAMRKTGIKRIASFDSDFDRIPGIERVF